MVANIFNCFGTCLYACSAESAKSRQHDSVAVVEDTNVKLGRFVVATKMQVEFEDGCRTSTQYVVGPYTPATSRLI